MAIVEAINIPIGVTGTETVQQAANSYEDLGDAVSKTQREAERLALQYGVNDTRTQEAITLAAKYKFQLEQLDTAIELNTSSMELLVSVTQSLVGGFSAAIGASALFGSNSEDLSRILVKVQGALALSEGLNNLRKELPRAVTGLIQKFRQLNLTVNTTGKLLRGLGIGALIVGVTLLIKNFDYLINKFKQLTDALGLTNFALQEEIKLLQGVVKEGERQIAVMEAQGATEDELLVKKIKNAQQALKLAIKERELAEFRKEDIEEAKQAELDAMNAVDIAEKNLVQFRLNRRKEFNQKMWELMTQEIQDNKALMEEIKKLDEEYLLYRFDPNGDYVKIQRKGRIFINKEAQLDAEREYIQLQNNKKRELELIEEAYFKELLSKESYEKKKAEIDEYYKDLEFKRTQKLKQQERDVQEEYAVGTAQMLIDLNNIFQGQKENQSRQEFEREKAFAIGQTLLQTYFAAQRAYASQINPLDPTSPIRASLAAAFATANGLARVATIRRIRYNDPNDKGSGSSASSSAAVPRFQAPTTRLPQTDEFTQVRRVYVTERDISNVQDKVRVTETLSQF